MLESWRDLRVGDRIRLTAMPGEFTRPGYLLHPDTQRAYERILATGYVLLVYEVDGSGLPWVSCGLRGNDGLWGEHDLAFNHDGWVRIDADG